MRYQLTVRPQNDHDGYQNFGHCLQQVQQASEQTQKTGIGNLTTISGSAQLTFQIDAASTTQAFQAVANNCPSLIQTEWHIDEVVSPMQLVEAINQASQANQSQRGSR